jgi:phosphoribosylglycinamide formyltransferase-1
MYGLHVHRAVLAAGETRTGATVHFVNKDYDQGAIIEQVNLEIPQGLKSPEALAAKVLPAEHKLLLQVLQRMVANHD